MEDEPPELSCTIISVNKHVKLLYYYIGSYHGHNTVSLVSSMKSLLSKGKNYMMLIIIGAENQSGQEGMTIP